MVKTSQMFISKNVAFKYWTINANFIVNIYYLNTVVKCQTAVDIILSVYTNLVLWWQGKFAVL